jgi:tetracycline repressor-like protein
VHEEHAIRREPGTRTGFRMGVALARRDTGRAGNSANTPARRGAGGVTAAGSAATAPTVRFEVLAEFTGQRRAALRALLERGVASGDIAATADLDMLADLAYGVLWYRLLIGHAPLDDRAARDLAAHLIAAGKAGNGPA